MRIATRVTIVLLLGMAVNVVVAWRGATFVPRHSDYANVATGEATQIWRRHVGTVEPLPDFGGSRDHFPLISYTMIASAAHDDNYEFRIVVVCDAGWPMRSVRAVQHSWGHAWQQQFSHEGAIALPDRVMGAPMPGLNTAQGRLLPVRPIWIGFIVNTLLYAGLVVVMFAVVGRIRRRARLDRRLCPQCRYDLRGAIDGETIRCSECGTLVEAALFDRPRQALGWWMAPFFVPPLALFAVWFFADGLRDVWPEWRVLWSRPLTFIGLPGLTSMGLMIALLGGFLYWLGMHAYADRTITQRHLLSAAIAAPLAVIVYFSVSLLVAAFMA